MRRQGNMLRWGKLYLEQIKKVFFHFTYSPTVEHMVTDNLQKFKKMFYKFFP